MSSSTRPKAEGHVVFEAVEEGGSKVPGEGAVKVVASTLTFSYPLKVFIPRKASLNSSCLWMYPVTYGGGFVEGDSVDLHVEVKERCSVVMATQGSTKVYKSVNGGVSYHKLTVNVAGGALFASLPDPTVPFAESQYSQEQWFYLEPDASLVALDWYTAGRVALGELWDCHSFNSCLNVFSVGKMVFRDSVSINKQTHCLKASMGEFTAIATCVLIGPLLESLSNQIAETLNRPATDCSKAKESMRERKMICTASKLKTINGVVIRIAAESTSLIFQEISRFLEPLVPLLGGDPFRDKC